MFRSLLLALLVLVPASRPALAEDESSKVMGSVHVPAGQSAEEATTVNGSVEIGDNATVKRAETVNGHITLGQHATADSVETVNGSARIGQGAHVLKGVELVNGKISLDQGADVGGRVTNVNGSIQLTAAHVGGGIETTTGSVEIGADSRVEGGILVNHAEEGWFSWIGLNFGNHSDSGDVPRVEIGPHAVVKGQLRFLREVRLYVSDTASIGSVEGAKVIKFSGDHAPQ